MPTFGEFETVGQPYAVSDVRSHVSTIWQARKSGAGGEELYAIKCYAPRGRAASQGQPEEALAHDRRLEFLEGVKQIKKAQSEGGRGLAPIHSLGTTATEAWYVTDFYPRKDLHAWIDRKGEVNGAALRHVVYSVVTACLALKRSRGCSHGNLKSSNVFLAGKPRDLRQTPLLLADAYPAAPLQLARLEADDRHEAGELLHQVMEAQDLAALGQLILQLVEGRLLSRSDDYNYPIERSREWDALGKDRDYWLQWCNKLLNPRLALETLNLETLATEFRPSATAAKLPMMMGGALGLCLVVAGGYFGIQALLKGHDTERTRKGRAAIQLTKAALESKDPVLARRNLEEARKWGVPNAETAGLQASLDKLIEQEYQDAIRAAQSAWQQQKYDVVVTQADIALGIRPNDPAAGKLRSDAEAEQRKQAEKAAQETTYFDAIKAARSAWQQQKYDVVVTQAGIALGIRPNDPAAGKLKSDAQAEQRTRVETAAQETTYLDAIKAARSAWQQQKYDVVVVQAGIALGISPNDPAAGKLKSDAQAEQRKQAETAAQDQKYEAALQAARSAWQQQKYDVVVTQAGIALGIRQNDPAAGKLKSDAQAEQRRQADTAAQETTYQDAINAARSAWQQHKYDVVVAQAGIALGMRPNDSAAGKLKSDAEAEQRKQAETAAQETTYLDAIKAARSAWQQQKYDVVVTQAGIALGVRPNDPAAGKLKSDAEAEQLKQAATAAQEKRYQDALQAARSAWQQQKYDVVVTQAGIALGIRPNDPSAGKLKSDAEAEQRKQAATAAQEKRYQDALQAARSAWQQQKYDVVVTQAGIALGIRPNDPAAGKLKSDAEAEQLKQAATAAQEKRYQDAIKAAQSAWPEKKYDVVVTQAELALEIKKGDRVATKLKTDAKEQQQKYETAMQEGRRAFERKEYATAMATADVALGIKPNDPAAGKLKTDAAEQIKSAQDQQKYEAAMREGRRAFDQKEYATAVAKADVALGIKPNDPAAGKLKTDAADQIKVARDQQKYETATQEGKAAFDRKDYPAAKAKAEEALGYKPSDPVATQLLAQVREKMAQQEAKLRQLLSSYEVLLVHYNILKPKDPKILTREGKAAERFGEVGFEQQSYDVREVKRLQSEFKAEGALTPERKDRLEQLARVIPIY